MRLCLPSCSILRAVGFIDVLQNDIAEPTGEEEKGMKYRAPEKKAVARILKLSSKVVQQPAATCPRGSCSMLLGLCAAWVPCVQANGTWHTQPACLLQPAPNMLNRAASGPILR